MQKSLNKSYSLNDVKCVECRTDMKKKNMRLFLVHRRDRTLSLVVETPAFCIRAPGFGIAGFHTRAPSFVLQPCSLPQLPPMKTLHRNDGWSNCILATHVGDLNGFVSSSLALVKVNQRLASSPPFPFCVSLPLKLITKNQKVHVQGFFILS